MYYVLVYVYIKDVNYIYIICKFLVENYKFFLIIVYGVCGNIIFFLDIDVLLINFKF